MKKLIVLSLALVLTTSLTGCGKNNIEKLPSLETIVEMDEGDINSVLPGYKIEQLKEAWGTPNDSDEQTNVWYLDDMRLIVNTNWLGEVVVCGLEKANQGQKPSNHDEKTIEAEITNIEEGIFWVQIDGCDVKVPIAYMNTGREPQMGDTIKIVYTGEISKEKPAIIENVLQIYLVDENQ